VAAGKVITIGAAAYGALGNQVVDQDEVVYILRIPLVASDAAAGIVSVVNANAVAVAITHCWLDVRTKTTGACTVDVGIDADGTGSANTLIDGQDIGTAAGLFASSAVPLRWDALGGTNDFITASMASGAAAGLVGEIVLGFVALADV